MLNKKYPPHDMNVVFDMMEEILKVGDCDEKAMDELLFLNRLMSGLPAEAVEYGMMFLHGNRDLPSSCDEIMPLYVRFVSLAEYCEKIESLRQIPENMTHEDIMARSDMLNSLTDHENAFLKPLLGFRDGSQNRDSSQSQENNITPDAGENNESSEEQTGSLHLLNSNAAVFVCSDPIKTALYYENNLGFKAVHLDDESMPHIKLTRDNVVLVLAKGMMEPLRKIADVSYDMYLYVSEPLLFYNEIKGNGVKIVEDLGSAEDAVNSSVNRQFVFEDIDGRHICVSQELSQT